MGPADPLAPIEALLEQWRKYAAEFSEGRRVADKRGDWHEGSLCAARSADWQRAANELAPLLSALRTEQIYRLSDVLLILRNAGIDTECGACAEVAFTGLTQAAHSCQAGIAAAADVSIEFVEPSVSLSEHSELTARTEQENTDLASQLDAAVAHVAALQQEVERLNTIIEHHMVSLNDWAKEQDRADAALAQQARLRAALEKWAQHTAACDPSGIKQPVICTCGLAEALADPLLTSKDT